MIIWRHSCGSIWPGIARTSGHEAEKKLMKFIILFPNMKMSPKLQMFLPGLEQSAF